jgi:hypothetical protein
VSWLRRLSVLASVLVVQHSSIRQAVRYRIMDC